jgi:hypothetical protein
MLHDKPLFRIAGKGTFVLALATICLWACGAAVSQAEVSPVGHFDDHSDVGSPALAGSATWNAASQEYRLSAAGVNMWGPRDEFQFVWKRLKGDFILRARIEFIGEGVDPHRKAGVIARTSLEPDSPYADAVVHGDGLTSLQFRRTKGAETEEVVSEVTAADVLQIERKGTTLTVSVARFGDLFQTSRVTDLDLGEDVYVGLFLCSHNPEVVEQAIFRNVRLVRPAPDDFEPYQDYIGSRLEILDRDPRPGERTPAGHLRVGGTLRGAELDARRPSPHLQRQREFGRRRAASPVRPHDAPAGPHRDWIRCPEQQ